MAIETEDLRQLALQLKDDPAECSQRASASRGYYYAYHICLNFAEANSIPDAPYELEGKPIHGAHEKLITRYTNYPNSDDDKAGTLRSIGHILNAMRTIRRDADYDLICNFDNNQAESIIYYANKIIEKMNNINP